MLYIGHGKCNFARLAPYTQFDMTARSILAHVRQGFCHLYAGAGPAETALPCGAINPAAPRAQAAGIAKCLQSQGPLLKQALFVQKNISGLPVSGHCSFLRARQFRFQAGASYVLTITVWRRSVKIQADADERSMNYMWTNL